MAMLLGREHAKRLSDWKHVPCTLPVIDTHLLDPLQLQDWLYYCSCESLHPKVAFVTDQTTLIN